MGRISCIVCQYSSGKSKGFFSIPSDENEREKWLTALNLKSDLPQSRKVCFHHFDRSELESSAFKCSPLPGKNL